MFDKTKDNGIKFKEKTAPTMDLKPISYIDMLKIMIVETQNELQKSEILERMAQRKQIEGLKMDIMLGQLQMKIKSFKETIIMLEEFLREALVNNIIEGV